MRTFARRLWKEWIKPLAVIVAVLGTFRAAVADWNDVPTGSMRPTIIEGDRILVNKAAYGLRVPLTTRWLATWGAPARGEIVILYSPKDGTRLVKRVVGVPGDTVELRNNVLYLNGVAQRYGPADRGTVEQIGADERPNHRFATERLGGREHAVMTTPGLGRASTFGPYRVPPGRYFVMGDNRDLSADSRAFGPVARHLIVGRSGAVAFSLDRDNWYLPRWGRFLRAMK